VLRRPREDGAEPVTPAFSGAAPERCLNGASGGVRRQLLCDDDPMPSRLSQPVGSAPAWAIALLAAASVALVPWSVALTTQLPAHQLVHHWDVAWAGFDVGMAIVLAATVGAALRGSSWLAGLAMGAAAMLVCDAWFDVVTSANAVDFWVALGSATAIELPLALVCVVVSRRALDASRTTRAVDDPDAAPAEPDPAC